MKSKNCCHEVQQDDKFCKLCGSKVELEVKMKKCPSCGSLQHTYESACTDCKEKIIMCKGMKADGSSCETLMELAQLFCSECGKKVGDADELDVGEHSKLSVITTKEVMGAHEDIESDEDIPEESLATGLAVICVHTTFKNNPLNLRERSNGPIDIDLMENIWNLYDCKVLPFMDEKSSFYDKKSSFYDKKLKKKIQGQLKVMPNVKYFVFVLSTHGDERPEKEKDDTLYYQHYFYTKDGQVKTQDLMTMINHIEEIKNKMKLFFIQACRCRATNTELDNQDPGFNVPITSTKQLSPDVSPTTIENKEAGYNPPKSTKGTDHTDARGYMPPEKIDPPFERIPHCDDCGVVFASTAGKYAYSKKNSEDEGGWMIRALYSTLHEYQKEDGVRDVHIIDVLGRINRKVSEKEAVFLISDFDSDDSVVGKCISHLSMLKDELIMELQKENKDSMDELIALKQQVIELQGRVVQEIKLGGEPKKTMINDIIIVRDKVEGKINGLVDTKAQSCFYHNLAFEDKDMTLYKSKTKSGVE